MAIGTGGPKAAPLKQSFTRRTEPCRRFAKGACNIGTKCRYQHVDAPGRPKQIPQAKRRNVGNGPGSNRTKVFAGQCFSCGRHGHRKADCKDFKKPQDSSHVVRERVNAWPTTRTEDQAWVAHSNFDTSRQFTFSGNQEGTLDLVSAAHHEQGTTQPMVWMVDGGTCHVLFAYDHSSKYIYNRRDVDIDIVGVGGRVKCREIGDICIRVITNGTAR